MHRPGTATRGLSFRGLDSDPNVCGFRQTFEHCKLSEGSEQVLEPIVFCGILHSLLASWEDQGRGSPSQRPFHRPPLFYTLPCTRSLNPHLLRLAMLTSLPRLFLNS